MLIFFIIVAIIIAFIYFGKQQHDEDIRSHHMTQGGMSKSFQFFSNYLENIYEMNLSQDRGNIFSYSKELKDINNNEGILTIGLKYGFADQIYLFSKYKNSQNTFFEGEDVSVIFLDDFEQIERYLNRTIEKIKKSGVISYDNSKNNLSKNPFLINYMSKWSTIERELYDMNVSKDIFKVYLADFFIPDAIDPNKFEKNFNIQKNRFSVYSRLDTTTSASLIFDIPKAFEILFVSAYPDVYLWQEAHIRTTKIYQKIFESDINDFEAYFNNLENKFKIYRALINEYKEAGGVLECV